ncbi:Mucin-associated surface protein (MASP) [Trypanosoma cruzi]|uniref:Mucin-associated surface protein (MASP), putative n=2 Tax=Trypanosoma cruzi TaxID=5693 RepID=Q4E1G2_TRYCC|nr:mucin-associated surface protein (MASP), putative [Trypanosoma cruzi]EAN98614.1 mucin-associated surface protein (MASP), putative [Trypanosoma cruzi]PWV11282.1 Mucin-associated surface protein (MASP) [Trypanosoma cruzi]|eukprot:XP_820465.1 mucin-associated surface protein (MASP) [Trypanosoma cruzi strain CL Brener]
MAMMTGRVLLVCALCVLWCGAGGCFANEESVGLGGGADLSLGSKGPETSLQVTQGLKDEAEGVKGKKNLSSSEDEDEEDEEENDDDDDDDDGPGTDEEERTQGQSDQEVKVTSDPNSREKKLISTEQQTGQSIVSAGNISPSGSQESNAKPLQTEVEGKKETDKSRTAVENALRPGKAENTIPGGIAGGNIPSPPEDGVDSREHDGDETTSEDKKNDPPPETAATPQRHRDEGSEGTGEDTKATTVTSNTTDTTNTQNSDGSSGVSHTTSPLLPLLVVACAAAAVVAA